MAVKSVSSAASSSAAASGGAAKGSSGATALLGAAANGAATANSGSASAGGAASATPVAAAANCDQDSGTSAANSGASTFKQLLGKAKPANEKPATGSDPAPATDDKSKTDAAADGAATPDALTVAMAMISQAMAQASPAPPQPAAPQAATPAAAPANAGGVAAASVSGAAQAGNGTSDAVGNVDPSQTTEQNPLAALLQQDADPDTNAPHQLEALQAAAVATIDSAGTSKSGASADHSGDATAGPTPLDAAQMSVGSHFSVQHAGNAAEPRNLEVKSPVGSAAWADEVGTKITWMAHQNIESASLRLSPAHLGPVEVKLSVQDGSASVWFGAAQADTRAALEQSLPRLREMFSAQGMNLADAGVSREPPRQQAQQQSAPALQGIGSVRADEAPTAAAMRLRLGLLDTYA